MYMTDIKISHFQHIVNNKRMHFIKEYPKFVHFIQLLTPFLFCVIHRECDLKPENGHIMYSMAPNNLRLHIQIVILILAFSVLYLPQKKFWK